MKQWQCKGLLTALIATWVLCVPGSQPVWSQDSALDDYLASGDGIESTLVAAADTSPAAGADEGTPERIEVTFEEAEQDILTRAALEKLDVIVESLEFSNADLQNVIRIIGERLDINFIFDAEDIDGKITLRLRNVRLRDALDSILTTRGLAIVPDRSGIFRIVPQERVGRSAVETRTEVVTLNWVSAEDVVKTMKPFLTEGVGQMEFNEEANKIIITDVPPQIAVIRDLISQIDIPERQVLIEARLADVNIGALRELSADLSVSKLNESSDWQGGATVVTGIDEDTGAPKLGLAGIPLAGLGSNNTLGVVNNLLEGFSVKQGEGTFSMGEKISIFGNDFSVNAVFTALESRNIVEILANPRVVTLNNVPAQIRIIERIPYIEAVQGPSANTVTAEIEFEEAGIDILAKPIITPNGYVRMEVQLLQRIFRERVGSGALDPPRIDERTADTNVIVESENTVVLGGLRQVRSLEGITAVPWLHRIPLFGWLFKDKNYDQDRTELVLMMTPRIVDDGAALNENEQYWYDKIETEWHLPDYFMDDTDTILDDQMRDNRAGD